MTDFFRAFGVAEASDDVREGGGKKLTEQKFAVASIAGKGLGLVATLDIA